MTDISRPEGSLLLLTALLYLPVSDAIFPATAPKQEDGGDVGDDTNQWETRNLHCRLGFVVFYCLDSLLMLLP